MKLPAIILAAGKGERLQPFTDHLPKPLLKIGGVPIIERLVIALRAVGITELHVVIGYLGQQIVDYLGDGSRLRVHITYHEQEHVGASEEAIRIGLSSVFSDFILCVCADDLITIHHLSMLISKLKGGIDGVFLVRSLETTHLPRVQIADDNEIIGVSGDQLAPIMIYNFAIRTQVITEWLTNISRGSRPLVYTLPEVLTRHRLLAVKVDDLITVNTIEQLRQAESFASRNNM